MKSKKILIIDDDPIIFKTLGDFLSEEGFQVISAIDGLSGLEKAQKEKPDLIVLDIILPRKNGYEVLEEIKKEESLKKTPVILLTNLGSLNDVEKAVKLGAVTYLVKSDYSLKEVAAKIKEALN